MKNPVKKTWRKMKSFGNNTSSSSTTKAEIKKSKSWNSSASLEDVVSKAKTKKELPRHGFFTVCVGPMRQRVVVKTKLVNHPLFKNLLEDAESEYGYIRDGPIVLPCDVDFFFKVLAQMKKSNDTGHGDDDDDDDDGLINPPICGLGTPYRRSCSSGGGGGTDFMTMRQSTSYKLLRSPSLFNLNRF